MSKRKIIRKKQVEEPVKDEVNEDGGLSSVVYIGHIPHGFYEEQIYKYCRQFGGVRKVRVARSPKTGKSRGYAFVEFYSTFVAKVFAESMNNYLMFERILKCEQMPKSKVHTNLFKGNKGRPSVKHIKSIIVHNNGRTQEQIEKVKKKFEVQKKKTNAIFKKLNIEIPEFMKIDSTPKSTTADESPLRQPPSKRRRVITRRGNMDHIISVRTTEETPSSKTPPKSIKAVNVQESTGKDALNDSLRKRVSLKRKRNSFDVTDALDQTQEGNKKAKEIKPTPAKAKKNALNKSVSWGSATKSAAHKRRSMI